MLSSKEETKRTLFSQIIYKSSKEDSKVLERKITISRDDWETLIMSQETSTDSLIKTKDLLMRCEKDKIS